jgi:hypothetical protein
LLQKELARSGCAFVSRHDGNDPAVRANFINQLGFPSRAYNKFGHWPPSIFFFKRAFDGKGFGYAGKFNVRPEISTGYRDSVDIESFDIAQKFSENAPWITLMGNTFCPFNGLKLWITVKLNGLNGCGAETNP